MNEARAGAVGADGWRWVEQALVPALVGGTFTLAGLVAVHVSAETRELRAEMGDIRSQLGEINGQLGGVQPGVDASMGWTNALTGRPGGGPAPRTTDRRPDSLEMRIDGLNERFGRLEDRMGRIEALLMAQRPPPNSGP